MPIAKKGGIMPVDKILSLRRNPQQLQREMEDRPSFLPRQLRADSPKGQSQEKSYRKNTTGGDDTDAELDTLPPPRRSPVSRQNLQRYRRTPEYYMGMLKMMSIVVTVCLLFAIIPFYRKVGLNHTVILLWNEGPTWERPGHMECGCVLTRNRNYNGEPFAAIVFNADLPYSQQGLETVEHTPDHLVVFSASAPLSLAQNPMPTLRPPFNLTMSYRLDSDLVWSEYYFTRLRQPERINVFDEPIDNFDEISSPIIVDMHEQLQRKDRLAVYMMYDVNDHTMAQSYYLMEVRKYAELEAHESCLGYHDCTGYHFMLIFEPSSCPDYVHPHFYQALDKYVVPVLIGGGNLTNLVPPRSYISSRDFASPKHLVAHLKALMAQPELYRRFFWWRSKYELRFNFEPYCSLCQLLKHRHRPQSQSQSPSQTLNPQEVPQEEPQSVQTTAAVPAPVANPAAISFVNWWQHYHCPNRTTSF
ncbi:alpha-(1,3)-fucosyltransferase C [Drosophila pseudoobscura]|uniref:Fucosyltransferase n=1 Tax=Drosophila pseudoobscura pseudoobscura TaxID=46245 RepID=A0A6I8UEG0_DROPS|nr:alpha-(1,3)-fucosyltransferase C [Drosophila pseudoobscura]